MKRDERFVSWKRWLLFAVYFFAVFELTAQFGFELRPHSIYPPLAWVAGPSHSIKRLSRRTSELGNPSRIYRGEKRRWAVIGSSWTDGEGYSQRKNWPSLLQHRFERDDIHITNYSRNYANAYQTLRFLVHSGQHFEKIFVSLDGPPEGVSGVENWAAQFPHSRPWLDVASRYLLSVKTLMQLWSGSEFSKTLSGDSESGGTWAASQFVSPFRRRALSAYPVCYAKLMATRNCAQLYRERREQEPLVDPWKLWRTVFLTCQRTVDRECQVPSRVDSVPMDQSRIDHWQKRVAEFAELSSQVAEKVYLVSHPMQGGPQDLPDAAIDNDSVELPIFNLGEGRLIVLSSLAKIQFRFLKTSTVEGLARQLRPETIDLHSRLLKFYGDRAKLFNNSTHLSELGHMVAADAIEAQVRSDDRTLSLEN